MLSQPTGCKNGGIFSPAASVDFLDGTCDWPCQGVATGLLGAVSHLGAAKGC